jgi:drug/metabolite transporter (DMT)-like permease
MLVIPEAYVGHAAGLLTSVLWTGTALCFTAAGRRLGATIVNASRIMVGVVLLGLAHRYIAGTWVPNALPGQVALLAISGIVGLSIGDQALFTAYMQIGPRLSMLIMTIAPLLAAQFAWLALGETLAPTAWLGIACTVGGVAWVVLERPGASPDGVAHHRTRGVVLAIIATVCQAGGYLLSKQGIGHGWLPKEEHIPAQSAALLRMFFAALGMLPIVAVHWARERQRRAAGLVPRRSGSRPVGMLLAFAGAFFGPFLGMWMSLEALDRVPLAVAQTLISLPPILILPLSRLVHIEHISGRAVLGALLAVGGVALLFLPQ